MTMIDENHLHADPGIEARGLHHDAPVGGDGATQRQARKALDDVEERIHPACGRHGRTSGDEALDLEQIALGAMQDPDPMRQRPRRRRTAATGVPRSPSRSSASASPRRP